MIGVVGTREPTDFGASATEEIVATLAVGQWIVVSGLAKGIDTIAHAAALRHRTPTAAVMAGGLDRIYPAENRGLAREIVEEGGALVSEHRVGVPPNRAAFVRRNRIQSGLSAALVVTQTGIGGGTMHTVRHAAAQGRPLFCAEPHSDNPRSEGLLDYDAEVVIDWSWPAADGAMTKAPLGGAKTGPNPTDRAKGGEALAPRRRCRDPDRDRSRRRRPQRPPPAERDARLGPDRSPDPTEAEPQGLRLDKGYDYESVRELVVRRRFEPTSAPAARKSG